MTVECPGCGGEGLLQYLTMLEDDLAERPFFEVQCRDLAHSREIVPAHVTNKQHYDRLLFGYRMQAPSR